MNSNTQINKTFLLDSNAFITPWDLYYSDDIVPSYWIKLAPFINGGKICTLDRVMDEIKVGNANLYNWLCKSTSLHIHNVIDPKIHSGYSDVLNFISTSPLYTHKALNAWSSHNVADPYIIGACKNYDMIIVTLEAKMGVIDEKNPCSKPKIPNIAEEFNVEWISLFEMMHRLKISI